MALDRLFGDKKLLGNFPIRGALREDAQDILLPQDPKQTFSKQLVIRSNHKLNDMVICRQPSDTPKT
jgi:hypothetical protein